jgi:hypothetical protein
MSEDGLSLGALCTSIAVVRPMPATVQFDALRAVTKQHQRGNVTVQDHHDIRTILDALGVTTAPLEGPISIQCPVCKVEPGEGCVTSLSMPLGRTHRSRCA